MTQPRGNSEVPIGDVGSAGRKKAVRAYFTPSPDPREPDRIWRWAEYSALSGIGAGALFFFFFAVGIEPPGLGVLAVGVGIVLAMACPTLLVTYFERLRLYNRQMNRAEPKPTDRQMDVLLTEDLGRAAVHAMLRLNITANDLALPSEDVDPTEGWLVDRGQRPIPMFGPSDKCKVRIGERDRMWRFNSYDVMVICATHHHLAIYECVLDVATGYRHNEEMHEFYYGDVMAVSLKTTKADPPYVDAVDSTGMHLVRVNRTLQCEFLIAGTSADRSSIIVDVDNPDGPPTRPRLQESNHDHVVKALRRLLRAKKVHA